MLQEIMEKRFELLVGQEVICKKTADSGRIALEILLEENSKINEEKAITFLTHLVMAIQRMEYNEEEPARLDPMIYKEIQNTDSFSRGAELLEKLCKKLERRFSECEREFLLVHLCNLLEP